MKVKWLGVYRLRSRRMSKASNVDNYMLHLIDAGSLVGTWQVGCTKAVVLPTLRERQVAFEFLTCAACRGLPGLLDKEK